MGMRSKHITDCRIPGLTQIDRGLVFPLCVEGGGGLQSTCDRVTEPNSLSFVWLTRAQYLIFMIKPRTSRFMTANNMRDVHLYIRSNTFIACKKKSHQVSGDSLHTFTSIGTHQFLPRSTVLTNINEINF